MTRVAPALMLVLLTACRQEPPAGSPQPVAVAAPGHIHITLRATGRVDDALAVVHRRLDALRDNELAPLAARAHVIIREDRIVIEAPLLPGASCESATAAGWVDAVARTVSRRGTLGFHRVPESGPSLRELLVQSGSGATVKETGRGQVTVDVPPADIAPVVARLAVPPGAIIVTQGAREGGTELLLVAREPSLTGAALRSAEVTMDEYRQLPQVAVDFTEEGSAAFSALSGDVVGQPLAILFEGALVSAPRVQQRIEGGRAVITLGAGPTQEVHREARELATILTAGAFVAPVEVLEQRLSCE